MKTIGMLGGTGWSSTIGYYKLLNELVAQRLGGYHSAKIILKSIDYHDIKSNYGKNHNKIEDILLAELIDLTSMNPDCIILCCNSLHKFFDKIRPHLESSIPIFHAVELVAHHAVSMNYKKLLFLATKFTMNDGFFAAHLENAGLHVALPSTMERNAMQEIHSMLIQNRVTQEAKDYFSTLIQRNHDCDAVVLGCTEYPLVVSESNSALPIIDPVRLQAIHAVDFILT